jgi:hypothetical protein
MWKRIDYETYTKKDFIEEDESDLFDAAMIWMAGKISDWEKETEIVATFSEPCQTVYACGAIWNEVMNGGFNQVIFNGTMKHALIAFQGFERLGLIALRNALVKGCQIYDTNKEQLSAFNDGSVDSFSESYELKLFDDVDREFVEEDKSFYDTMVQYIKANIEFFGN